MPILSGCCIFFDLKSGSKIIGVLNLIGALLNTLTLTIAVIAFVVMGIGANTVNSLSKALEEKADDYEDEYVDVREEEGPNIMEIFLAHIASVTIVLYVLLALCILMVITSSMLIHGVKNDRRGLLVPYIIQEILNVIIFFALFIWMLVVFGTDMKIVGTALSMLGAVLLHVYFGLVVFSQYQALGLIRMHEEHSMK